MADPSDEGNEKAVRWSEEAWQAGFTMIPNKLLLESGISSNALRIYLLLAHFSWRPDTEWPGQEAFARLAQCGEKTFRAAIKELEAAGIVRSRRRGLGLTNVYVLVAPRTSGSRTVEVTVQEGAPSTDPSVLSKTKGQEGTAIAVPERGRPKTVDRRPVKDQEWKLASEILAAYNRIAGQRLTAAAWTPKIIMRIREYPSLALQEHIAIIATAFSNPWWKGPPTPSVVYGNAPLFERAWMTAEQGASPTRSLSAEEMETYAVTWGPGTPYPTLAAARAAGHDDVIEGTAEEIFNAEGH